MFTVKKFPFFVVLSIVLLISKLSGVNAGENPNTKEIGLSLITKNIHSISKGSVDFLIDVK